MSCGICLASHTGLSAAQTQSQIAVMCAEIGLLYCRMATLLNRSSYSLISCSMEVHAAIESCSINQAAQVQARQVSCPLTRAALTSASQVTSCQPCIVTAQVPASLLSDEQRRRTGVLHSVWAHRVKYGSSTGVSHHSPQAEMPPNPPLSIGAPLNTSCCLPENSGCLSDMCLQVIIGSSCRASSSLLFPDKEQLLKSECSPC